VENSEETAQQETQLKPKTRFEILTEKIDAIKARIEDQEDIYRQLSTDKKEQKTSIENEAKRFEQLKKDKKLKMQVAMLLDNPEESKEKLEQTLEVAKKRRENLNNKFETHKQPLEAQLESFSGTNAVKLQKVEEQISSIRAVKRLIQDIQEDVKNKTQAQQQLQTELKQMKRVTERSAYTSRIIDIVKNIKKQNNDINEILKDTKMLQKAINNVEGQLQRQFTVTEDLIWNNVSA
jgi:coiled-coil domain-containing protein 22